MRRAGPLAHVAEPDDEPDAVPDAIEAPGDDEKHAVVTPMTGDEQSDDEKQGDASPTSSREAVAMALQVVPAAQLRRQRGYVRLTTRPGTHPWWYPLTVETREAVGQVGPVEPGVLPPAL
jgi:hypothetical protein